MKSRLRVFRKKKPGTIRERINRIVRVSKAPTVPPPPKSGGGKMPQD
jgi:hypothetical protein